MQNDFEREVRRKLEELRMEPTPPVWERVKVEIRDEKRKRRAAFWLFAGILLLLFAGGWWLNQLADNNSQARHQTAGAKETTPQTSKPAMGNDAKKSMHYSPDTLSATTSVYQNETSISQMAPANGVHKRLPTKQLEKVAISLKLGNDLTTAKGSYTSFIKASNADYSQKMKMVRDAQGRLLIEPLQTVLDSIVRPVPKIPIEDSIKIKEVIHTVDASRTDSSSVKKNVVRMSWSRQIMVSAGSTGYNGQSDIKTSAMAYQSPSPVSGGLPPVEQPASNAFGFSLGIVQKKALSGKLEVGIGLNYVYSSTRQKVGRENRNDTALQSFLSLSDVNRSYANTANNDYINRFHYLVVPVLLSYRPLKQLPVEVVASVAYARLLSSQALSYNKALDVYYRGGGSLRENTVSFSASVQISLRSRKLLPVSIGPYIQCDALTFQKTDGSTGKRLATIGMQSFISF